MSEIFGLDDQIHFGAIDAPLPDWRTEPIDDDDDPDDDEMESTPQDVIDILGFDPLEISESESAIESAGSIGPMPHSNYGSMAVHRSGKRITKERIREAGIESPNYERSTNEKLEQALAETDPIERRKGLVNIQGLVIAIENPMGSIRSGVGPDGQHWQSRIVHHYGEIVWTDGSDNDPVDCFIGPDPDSEIVYVIDQVDASGKFDEHKAMIGWASQKSAAESYLANYQTGWNLGTVTAVTMDDFKRWVKNVKKNQPFALAKGLDGLNTDEVLEKVLERAWSNYP